MSSVNQIVFKSNYRIYEDYTIEVPINFDSVTLDKFVAEIEQNLING